MSDTQETKSTHAEPTIGSEWTEKDTRGGTRNVRVEGFTDTHVILRNPQVLNRTTKVKKTEFSKRYLPARAAQ